MEQKPRRNWGRSFLRGAVYAFVALFIYSLGVNVGNGSLSFVQKSASNQQLPGKLDYEEADKVYQSLKQNYDGKLDKETLEEGLKHGLAEATKDPYTVYFTPKEAKDFEDQLNNSFAGIGARLSKDGEGNLVIGEAIEGFPAQKAGLQPKDIIVSVNGEEVFDLTLDDAISKIRGPAGTKVKLEIVRNRSESLSFTITRQEINLPSVETKMLDGNIGYIQINSFSPDTNKLATEAADDFKAKNVKGVILDLRDNPGGLLEASVQVSSLWLPSGKKVLEEKQGSRVIETEFSSGRATLRGIPTVALINGGSASASEIVAGALRDHNAAYLIGEKTYGKGVVQELVSFKDGSQLKVTVASWYRPNGQNINKKGIKPDKTIKISETDAKAGKDTQLEAAQAYINSPQQ